MLVMFCDSWRVLGGGKCKALMSEARVQLSKIASHTWVALEDVKLEPVWSKDMVCSHGSWP